VRGAFMYERHIEPPERDQRAAYLGALLRWTAWGPDVDMGSLAESIPGYVLPDLREFAQCIKGVALARARALCDAQEAPTSCLEACLAAGWQLRKDDATEVIATLTKRSGANASKANIPNVTWKDIGGLQNAKDEILDTIQLPLTHPELFAEGVRQRSGVILYGPPGTGKTLLAKAVATECKLSFIGVKGPELINSYIGESEKNIREVFQRARDCKPCVIFFDELDALAPNRGVAGDSGGVMDRIVSQLLAEMDGMDGNADVFILGATNRLDLLDQSLLRPGRFDRQVYLGLPEDHESRLSILRALTRKFSMAADVDLDTLVANTPVGFTGADFYALASDALMNSIRGRASELELIHGKAKVAEVLQDLPAEELKASVAMEHFQAALGTLKPSLTAAQVEKYKSERESEKDAGRM